MVKANNKLTSEGLAVLVVDGLLDAKLLKEGDFDSAVEVTEREIEEQKISGYYFLNHRDAISSESLANLIVGALLSENTIEDKAVDTAVKVITLEIDIRKTAGDY